MDLAIQGTQRGTVWITQSEPYNPSGNIVTEEGLYCLLPQYLPDGYIGKTLELVLHQQAQDGQVHGAPETIKGGDNHKIDMDEAYQWFWFGLLEEFAPPSMSEAELKKQWAKLTNGHLAFTNQNGSDTHRDYINDTHREMGPMRQETITCCRNVVKRAGNPFRSGGMDWLPTHTINRDEPPPSVAEVKAKPWLIHRALVIRSNQLEDGTYMENPFDHLQGADVPVPWASHGGINALPLDRLSPLYIGDLMPGYYNPPR